jgi:pyrroloquinoline quinone biosynthesis protein A
MRTAINCQPLAEDGLRGGSHENHEIHSPISLMHINSSKGTLAPWPTLHAEAITTVPPARHGETPIQTSDRRFIMAWQTPAACDMRFGFEITMYVANR